MLMVSGSVRIALYPFAAATAASPIPVFPLVGSIIVAPGFKMPRFSASSIIASAILSLTDPAGFKYSSFAKITALFTPAFLLYLPASRSGVPPINSNELFLISAMIFSSILLLPIIYIGYICLCKYSATDSICQSIFKR